MTERKALEGIKVIDAATLFAGPLAATVLGDFGAEVLKVEHPRGDPARTHGYSKDGVGLWWKMLGRNKRAVTLNLSKPEGQEVFERSDSGSRRRNRELQAWHHRAVEPRLRAAQRDKPGPDPGPGDRLRPARTVQEPSRVRDPGRVHERLRPRHGPARRAADAPAVRARGRHRGSRYGVRDPHRPQSPRRDGPRAGRRPRDHRADLHRPRAPTHRLRPARSRPGEERQPLREQRPAQHLPDEGRQLARRLDERPEHRRARDAPGRASGIHRRALVREGLGAGQARGRARRGGGNLDLRAYPGRGSGGLRGGGSCRRPHLQHRGHHAGPSVRGTRLHYHRGRPRARPREDAERPLQALRDAGRGRVVRSSPWASTTKRSTESWASAKTD